MYKKVDKFYELLKKSLERQLSEDSIAIAFSGGVDSCIIAKMLMDLGANIKGYVVGIKGSHDLQGAKKASKEIGLDLIEIIIDREKVKKALNNQVRILEDLYQKEKGKIKSNLPPLKPNPVSVSFNLPLYFVLKNAKEDKVFSGQGPDTMLGGFAKHMKLSKKEAIKEMEENTKDLVETGYLQHLKTGEYFDKTVLMPYLDKRVVRFCLDLPYELKIRDNKRKYLIRELAKKVGLSKDISFRKKKSAQYGTGIMKLMKKLAKQKGMHISRYIEELR